MKENIDKSLIELSKHVADISHYVIIMNWPTMKKFLAELIESTDKVRGDYAEIHELAEYKGHKLVYDLIVPDGEVAIMNWDDYAREKDNFNKRMGLHL